MWLSGPFWQLAVLQMVRSARFQPPDQPAPPSLLVGGYEVLEELGRGGMGVVYRARHRTLGHEVAVKVLPRYLAKNATLLQRFLREAKTAATGKKPSGKPPR